MEAVATHLFAVAAGAAAMWWMNRSTKRQFTYMLEAIDQDKEKDRDFKLVYDSAGQPIGFRLIFGASAPTDRAGSI